jgi:hypothetical protein
MSAERASPKTGDMSKVNDALKAFKSKPAAKPAAKPASKAKRTAADRDKILSADTLKTGGKVKGYAAGGFTRSADGIAQRGKTRAQQFCSGGMSKGRK